MSRDVTVYGRPVDGDVPTFDRASGKYHNRAPSGGEGSAPSEQTGMLIGVPSILNSTTIQITYDSVYGIDSNGHGYYDPAGAAAGDAAKLQIDSNGYFYLTKPQGALAL